MYVRICVCVQVNTISLHVCARGQGRWLAALDGFKDLFLSVKRLAWL